jgi:sporulation protein YlmC with PRC-barrel domain
MDIALDAKVHFSEDGTGKITKVVVNPITGKMTHIVVRAKGSFEVEYLVPVDKIVESKPQDVSLAITMSDLRLMDTYERIHYLSKSGPPEDSADPATIFWPFMPPGDEGPMYVMEVQVPPEDLVVNRGSQVNAADGKIGKVDGFMVNPENSHVTHLVLEKGHFWGDHDVAIPINAIDNYDGQVVTLKLDRDAVDALPRLKVKWG